jgi:hypothetical protein
LCNEGGEFMAAEKIERLAVIADQTWLRTLDDTLGISWEEKLRKQRAPETSLPEQSESLSLCSGYIALPDCTCIQGHRGESPRDYRLQFCHFLRAQ